MDIDCGFDGKDVSYLVLHENVCYDSPKTLDRVRCRHIDLIEIGSGMSLSPRSST